MNVEERRARVADLISNPSLSPSERLESIERIYNEYSEAALLCLHAASVAEDKGDEEGRYAALADAAEVLTFALDGSDIIVRTEHQDIIREANRYAIEHPEDEE